MANFYVKSRDITLLKNLSQELIGDISQQKVDISRPKESIEDSAGSYDSLYGEVTDREDITYDEWTDVPCFVEVIPPELINKRIGIDAKYAAVCYFDYDYVNNLTPSLNPREGDIIVWAGLNLEIVYANREGHKFGLEGQARMIRAEAVTARRKVV